MLTVAISLKRAMAIAALALATSASFAAGPAGATTPTASSAPTSPDQLTEHCVAETHLASGPVVLGGAVASFDTGLVVPVSSGTTLRVTGVSADGLDPSGHAWALTVTIGGVVAAPGASVPGGSIVVLAEPSTPVELPGVTVVLDRCTGVASAPLVGPGAPSAPPTGELPRTGGSAAIGGSWLGLVAIGAGSAMVVAGRRRAGSQR